MMAGSGGRALEISVRADDSQLAGDLDRASGKLRGFGAAAAAALASAGIVDIVTEARNSARGIDNLGRVLRAQGDTTGQAAKRQAELRDSIRDTTGASRETIIRAQLLAASFRGVGATAGTAGGTMERILVNAARMAAAGFGDLEDNAQTLGEAMADPASAIDGLAEKGVVFSEKQKTMIQRLVDTGDTAGAQKLILAELGKTFGTVGDQGQDGLGKLSSAAQKAKEWLGDKLVSALSLATEWVEQHIVPALTKLRDWIQRALDAGFWDKWGGAIKTAGLVLAGAITVVGLWRAAVLLATTAQLLFNVAMDANPIGLVVLALAALAGAIKYAYDNNEDFRKKWDEVWSLLEKWWKENGPGIVDFIGKVAEKVNEMRQAIADWWSENGPAITQNIKDTMDRLGGVMDNIEEWSENLRGWARTIGETLNRTVTFTRDRILDPIVGALQTLIGLPDKVISGIGTVFGRIQTRLILIARQVVSSIRDAISAFNSIPLLPDIPLPSLPAIDGGSADDRPRGRVGQSLGGTTIVVQGLVADPEGLARVIKQTTTASAARMRTARVI